jgi:O-antigen/teichoic acid export membrane protein
MTPPLRQAGGPFRRMWRNVRLRPFNQDTEEGRGRERYRRAALTALASGGARLISLATVVVSVPLTLGHLGPERYGAVVTITALTGMLLFADFGLGNGLMNLVAAASGRDSLEFAKRSISSAFFVLCGIAVILAVPFYVLYLVVPWATFLNVSSHVSGQEIAAAAGVFLLSVLVNLPLGIVQRVQLAYQRGFLNGLWSAVGSLAALAALYAAIRQDLGLPWIVLALVSGPIIGNLLNGASLFWIQRPDLRPRWSQAAAESGRQLARVGFLFFVLQLTIAIAFQSDVVVAAKVIGPQAATDYSVTFRLFMFVPTIVNLLLLPLWPAYAESIARGDVAFVGRTLRVSIAFAFVLSGLSSLILVLLGPLAIRLWVGSSVNATLPLLLGMAVWAVLSNSFNAVAMLLNGANVIRFQIATALTMTIVSIVGSAVLGSIYGVAGVIWGTVLAYVICTAIPTAIYLPRVLAHLQHSPDRVAASAN